MNALRALRALARVELRALRRNRARSLLVIALVAVPVAAMAGGGTLLRIVRPTADERRVATLGSAALRVDAGTAAEAAAARASLPPDARVDVVVFGQELLRAPGRRIGARSLALDLGGLGGGIVRIVRGRAPAAPDEVALSPVALASLALDVGDRVTHAERDALVTGVAIDPEELDLPLVVRSSAAPPAGGRYVLLAERGEPSTLRAAGHHVVARGDVGEPDAFEAATVFVVGGFGLFEAGLVVAAAFAVGLRRRQRELGLLAAAGATPAGLCAAVLASAAVLAALGAALGVAVGLGAAAAAHPFLAGWNARANGPFEVSWAHVGGASLLGIVAALGAVVLPARAVVRLPVRVALAGRRPPATSSGRWLGLGLALAATGVAVQFLGRASDGALAAVAVLAGSILGVLGLGACSPALLALAARSAGRLPLVWRLAVRDAGRFRARNGPVVTAVLASMSISVLVGSLVASIDALVATRAPLLRDDHLWVDGPGAAAVAERLASELDVVAAAPLRAVYAGGAPLRARGDWVALAGEELWRALDVAGAAGALREGKLVVLDAQSAELAPSVELTSQAGRALGRVDVVAFAPPLVLGAPRALLGESALARLGLASGPPPGSDETPWLVRLSAPVERAVLARAQDVAVSVPGTAVDAQVARERPQRVFFHLVLLACLATGTLVVLAATTLSSVESTADARVLHAVGAAPRVTAALAAARACYLALFGCVLAIPAGLLPALGLASLADVELTPAIPWAELVVVALALPALSYSVVRVASSFRRRVFVALSS